MINIYDMLDSFFELAYIENPSTHEILYMNKPGKKIFGECEGKLCREISDELSKICADFPADTLGEDKVSEWLYKNETTGKIYIMRGKIIDWKGIKAQLKIAFDITDSEESRHNLELRLDMEHFIVSCIIEMHKESLFEESFNTILARIGNFFEADRVYVFDYNGVTTNNTHEWCAEGIVPQINSLQNVDAHVIDRWLPVFEKKECVIIEDVEEIKNVSPAEYKLLKHKNVRSLVSAPLDKSGEIIGYIGIDNPPPEKIHKSGAFFAAFSYFISLMIIREMNENKLREMSYMDNLTGIYNRNKFLEDIEKIKDGENKGFGVLYMDLNGLKRINDKSGHGDGDKALKKMADVISEAFGRENSYRVGGDEFVALYRGGGEETFEQRINNLRNIIVNSEYSFAIGYQYSDDAGAIDEIIKTADEKMYLDKKFFYRNRESGRYRFRNDTFAAISTAESLKKLIKEERFVIWFQPRFSIDSGGLCGSEALIRFFDEDDVIVSPMDFVPELENNETIHLIDLYVFKHVCEYVSGWIKDGKNVKPVSVNMSHQTMLRPNFIENIMNIWYDYHFPKDLIIIEVSEDRESGGISKIINVLGELKKRGFKIAIDNFGAKYADLYLFADLKFDILKLDGDMVYKIETDNKTRLLSKSIAQICHNENIRIVAEGVENKKELEILKKMNCDEAQGYFFDKPMSWNKFEEKYL